MRPNPDKVFSLYYLEKLSVDEVATRLNIQAHEVVNCMIRNPVTRRKYEPRFQAGEGHLRHVSKWRPVSREAL